MSRLGWVDASSGASGDMLLGALVGAGVPLAVLQESVDLVVPEPVVLREETVTRNGFAATRVHVEVVDGATHRTWADIEPLLAALPAPVRTRAMATFTALARAEGAVHGTDAAQVHFHEVGALDAIADVVGVCAGLEHLRLDALTCSPVALGGGRVRAAHGTLPVPAPAVVEVLRGLPSYGGPVDVELCTPTGAALLATAATSWGTQPAMTVDAVGTGAGGRDPDGHTNALRLLVGGSVDARGTALVLETNVDDLDPRLWPDVLAALLEAGASDAWLTPILMKKGRPAHTLHALVTTERAAAVRRVVFTETTAIGVREVAVGKTALDREMVVVGVDGQLVAVKLARLEGVLVNVQPEWEDVRVAAVTLGRPAKEVLAEAVSAARRFT